MTAFPSGQPMYENGLLNQATGGWLHPGGAGLTERMLSLCELPANARILDLGCGTGSTLKYLQRAGFRAIGIDHSEQLIQAGKNMNPGAWLSYGSGQSLPMTNGLMDAVIAECSLSAISNRDAVLAECWRVLCADGKLAISDIYALNPEGIPSLQALPLSCGLREVVSKDDLVLQLQNHGFEILVWEDHSNALKHLAAQVILTHGSLSEFWSQSEPAAEPGEITLAIGKAKLSYYLVVARKR